MSADGVDPTNVGRRNIYTCRSCRRHIVTVDVDAGHAPLSIGCHATLACRGTMASSMYKVFDQTMQPDMEFYRPPAAQMLTVDEAKLVAGGGLLMRFPPGAPKPMIRKLVEAKTALGEIERMAEKVYRSEDLDEIATTSKEIGQKASLASRALGEFQ